MCRMVTGIVNPPMRRRRRMVPAGHGRSTVLRDRNRHGTATGRREGAASTSETRPCALTERQAPTPLLARLASLQVCCGELDVAIGPESDAGTSDPEAWDSCTIRPPLRPVARPRERPAVASLARTAAILRSM